MSGSVAQRSKQRKRQWYRENRERILSEKRLKRQKSKQHQKTAEPTPQEVLAVVRQLQNPKSFDRPSLQNSLRAISGGQETSEPTSRTISDLWLLIKNKKLFLVQLALYSLVVPTTAMVLEPMLQRLALPYPMVISFILAAVIDGLALAHLSRASGWKKDNRSLFNSVIGFGILAINVFGVFVFLNSNSGMIADTTNAEVEARVEWLTAKWPGASDPEACEAKIVSCSTPYSKAAKPLHTSYLVKKAKSERLSQASPSNSGGKDVYLHLGYFVFIWLLILAVIRLENEDKGLARA